MNRGFIAAVITVAAAAGVLLLLGRIKEQFDSEADLDMATGTITPQIIALAKAIATAEGFGLPGAIPTLAHNPGDLVIPGWTGAKLGTERISVFSNDAEGWDRLYKQLLLIVSNKSHIYSLSDTLASMAAKWTNTAPSAWAMNVASSLGVTADTTLRDLIGVNT